MKQNERIRNLKRAAGILKNRALIGPEMVQINIVGRCNQACRYCWIYSGAAKLPFKLYNKIYRPLRGKNKDFPFGKFKEVVNSLCSLGTPTLCINGDGEPFLHPDIGEMVGYAHNKGLKVGIQTNGTIPLENFNELHKLSFLNIHLLSPTKANFTRLQPKSPDNFNKVIDNLQLIKNLKKKGNNAPEIELGFVVNGINCGEINKIFDFALEHGVESVNFKKLRSFNHVKELRLDEKDISTIQKNFLQILKSGRFRKIKHNIPAFLKELKGNLKPSHIECFLGYHHAHIGVDGRVCFCCWNPFTAVGNVFKEDLERIWFSRASDKLRRRMKNINTGNTRWEPCKTCPLSTIDLNKKLRNLTEYWGVFLT